MTHFTQIFNELVNGKMNLRKFVLWLFLLILFGASSVISVGLARAVWAVSSYTVANPQAWVNHGRD